MDGEIPAAVAAGYSVACKSRPIRWSRHAAYAVVVSLVFASQPVRATCAFTTGGFGVVTFTAPSTIAVPRDAPNGTVVRSLQVSGPPAIAITCTGDPYGVVNFVGATAPIGQSLMPIGTTGLSWRWAFMDRGVFEPSYGTRTLNGTHSSGSNRPQTLELVKTGAISAGTVVPAGEWGRRRYGAVDVWSLRMANSIAFTTPSCSTTDVAVPMGTHMASGLSGIGSSTGQVSFSISLECAAGVRAVRYRLDPLTAVVHASQSVVALDAVSSATGIGLQLLNGTGSSPLPLSADQSFSGFSGAGSSSIPLRARYYQTGATVGGGSANASMTFTLRYE
jgi:major type 1 subunit fimbrin (pilin)